MTIQEAIKARHSVRQYVDKAIEPEKIEILRTQIAECNREGNLNMQLVVDEPRAFASGLAKYGKFTGISNYIAMVCRKGDDVNLGYYGEKIVILAQSLGLNTCWVGLTYKKISGAFSVSEGEKLLCLISIGYGENQGVQHPLRPMAKFLGAETKKLSDVKALPQWFVAGMESALLAPTALNQQKFEFTLEAGNLVSCKTRFALNPYAHLDLGIVKYHFEVGAGAENFIWK